MLRVWLEAQPIFVIVLVVFAITYLFAALVFVLVSIAPANWLHHFKQISSETVTALAGGGDAAPVCVRVCGH